MVMVLVLVLVLMIIFIMVIMYMMMINVYDDDDSDGGVGVGDDGGIPNDQQPEFRHSLQPKIEIMIFIFFIINVGLKME